MPLCLTNYLCACPPCQTPPCTPCRLCTYLSVVFLGDPCDGLIRSLVGGYRVDADSLLSGMEYRH